MPTLCSLLVAFSPRLTTETQGSTKQFWFASDSNAKKGSLHFVHLRLERKEWIPSFRSFCTRRRSQIRISFDAQAARPSQIKDLLSLTDDQTQRRDPSIPFASQQQIRSRRSSTKKGSLYPVFASQQQIRRSSTKKGSLHPVC